MFNLFGNLDAIKNDLAAKKAELAQRSFTGEAAAGDVVAVVNGNRQVIKITISPSIFKAEEQELVQDLTVAAVNAAYAKMEAEYKAEIAATLQGKLPNIPGLDIGQMLGGL